MELLLEIYLRYSLNVVELKGFLSLSNPYISNYPRQILVEKCGFAVEKIQLFDQSLLQNSNRKNRKTLLRDLLRTGCVNSKSSTVVEKKSGKSNVKLNNSW